MCWSDSRFLYETEEKISNVFCVFKTVKVPTDGTCRDGAVRPCLNNLRCMYGYICKYS